MERDSLFDYKRDVEINENNLDAEWIRQAGLYAHWAVRYAEELALKDRIWLQKKILKARKAKEYRLALMNQDGKAPSDNRVDIEVHADSEYEAVSIRLIEAEERVNMLDEIKWAMVQRLSSLERLSKAQDRRMDMPDGYKGEKRERERTVDEALERQHNESLGIAEAMRTKARINRG